MGGYRGNYSGFVRAGARLMARFIAFNAVFFLLPFAGYAAWLVATRGSAASAADWPMRTVGYLAISGAAFLVAALVVFTSFSGAPPGSHYRPATIDKNGKLVPGHFE
jgi:hypothetical protein